MTAMGGNQTLTSFVSPVALGSMRCRVLLIIIFLALTGGAATTSATGSPTIDPPKGLSTYEMEGRLGPYQVGMNILVRDYAEFVSGHYFYASKLLDIPLKGKIEGEMVTLQEPGGGVFHLHLRSNETAKSRPLNFYISTGLKGSWTQGSKTLPVSLGFTAGYDGPSPTRWYSNVTNESDSAFESRVRNFLRAVNSGDKASTANLVSYPLRVNARGPFEIRTEGDLLAKWDRIFTPALKLELRQAIPHEMFVHNGLAMVANGAVWFDDKGAAVINETR
jgi:hypothetical protein